jgi:hypothetical protein
MRESSEISTASLPDTKKIPVDVLEILGSEDYLKETRRGSGMLQITSTLP